MPNDGKQLELEAANVLRAAGYVVRGEQLLGSKKVDLLFEINTFGKLEKYAVECKDYASPLPRDKTAKILSEYQDILDKGKIDKLLLVTRQGLTPTAKEYVLNCKNFLHQTFHEMQNSMIDFSSYLKVIISSYENDLLSNYYVPQKTTKEEALNEIVLNWIKAPSQNPIAILGSYGMGKTTFVAHMGAYLAKQALEDSSSRIPIIIPLSNISSEQTLSGLLGTLFTANHMAKGYTFSNFNELNLSGRFVIFLDGFDEMKHALRWGEFVFNLRQILELINAKSKIILLGRPTAFLTEDEHQYALHGKRRIGDQMVKVEGWPDFTEFHLASFTKSQIETFIKNYLRSKSRYGNDKNFSPVLK